ncbi:MAG: DUF4266 domain-containing protein [Ectothiorhodospiraceae bacterium]|nr:DUF4266 domain-containing protein [Ectothiorhodospiraceae bacterium]
MATTINSGVYRVVFAGSLIFTFSACSVVPVQPWDRDLLAQQKMQLVADPLEIYFDEHIYFSKEASSGGQGVGGGGCGCN